MKRVRTNIAKLFETSSTEKTISAGCERANITSSREYKPSLSRRSLLVGTSALAATSILSQLMVLPAQADELAVTIDAYDTLAEEIATLQEEIEQAADDYYKAEIVYKAAQTKVDEIQERIEDNTREIKKLQQRLSERISIQYRSDELGVIDILMGSTSFEDFATKWDLVGRMNENDAALAAEMRGLRLANKFEASKLKPQQEKAEQRFEETEAIKKEAEKKIAELEKLYEETTGRLEELLGMDQAAALANAEDILIIGNPRNIPPHPEVVEFAKSRIGCPYVWAAAGPSTFDCSGLVVWAFDKAGIKGLPHYTESLYRLALRIGAVVKLEDVEPGDVLYRPGHVGIASGVGGRPYIHAPYTGALVRDTDSLAYARFVCGLRYPGAGTLSQAELMRVLAEVEAEVVAEEEAKRARKEEEERNKKESEAQKKAEANKKKNTSNTQSNTAQSTNKETQPAQNASSSQDSKPTPEASSSAGNTQNTENANQGHLPDTNTNPPTTPEQEPTPEPAPEPNPEPEDDPTLLDDEEELALP